MDNQPFDDPTLKLALREMYGAQMAPPQLRAAVVEAMARSSEARSAEPAQLPLMRLAITDRRWWRPVVAAAAVLLVALGVWVYGQHQRSQKQQALLLANASLVQRLVRLHEGGVGTADVPLTASFAEPEALAAEASRAVGRTVPAPQLGEGWTIDAASVCDLSGRKVARFRFVNAGRSVTLLTLPSVMWYGDKEATDYSLQIDEHPIAGYLAGNSLNCVIGDRAMPIAEAVRLRERLRRS